MDHSAQAASVFNQLSALYQQKYMDQSAFARELDLFLHALPDTKEAVLDIACGPGNIVRWLLDKNPALLIKGFDLAPTMIELAEQNCPEAEFAVMDCRHLHTLSETFKGIVCGFCLPYLNQAETEKLLQDISRRLIPGGVLYLSTILGDYKNSDYRKSSTGHEVFTYYYGEEFLFNSLVNNGLTVFHSNKVIVPDATDTDLVLIAKKEKAKQ